MRRERASMGAKRCALRYFFKRRSIRSVGLMDKASASGAGDSRFESWADQMCEEDWECEKLGGSCCSGYDKITVWQNLRLRQCYGDTKRAGETRAHGAEASHPLRMRKALRSNPSVSREETVLLPSQ